MTNETNTEIIMKNESVENGRKQIVSDDVIIEVVHAFKDIIIEFINRKYV